MSTARLEYNGQSWDFPVVEGTENELGVDISELRAKSGLITLDEGYGNTGSCKSAITYIDGDKGILRYRGYPIEQIAEQSSFVESAWLVIYGELPNEKQRERFSALLTKHAMIHESMRNHFQGFPNNAPPMAILSAMINAIGCFSPEVLGSDTEANFEENAARLLSQVRSIAAATYKMSMGQPMMYPRPDFKYCENFLHMMFSVPNGRITPDPDAARALNQFLTLHADHEQNCSTSTVRMVASSGANMYASVSAGVSALWGPLHGGANVAVVNMLEEIRSSGMDPHVYMEKIKDKNSKLKLMGFGHRVYRNFDPRSRILQKAAEVILSKLKIQDPLLEIARRLEEVALRDSYFVDRKLYPNVDFYSGIILRAIGIPLDMFTVMFAIGRMPGWIANYKEIHDAERLKINRPRQIYTGAAIRDFVPRDARVQ
ncbi:MAG: citrate synthase [Fibrobacteres bacterium]|nr:citrate synthase [Fibrobacterota bacterium]